jgi:hypothetical protein
VVALLLARGLHPIIIGDRWYACAPFLTRLADVEAWSLLRVKSNRVFYRPAPERLAGQLGASRKDGERFQCQDESSHGDPDESWEGLDAKGARIQVRCWNHLHLRTARAIEVSVIQIIRHGASGKARDHKISWFVWKGGRPAPLAEISPTHRLRDSHEHGYRFDKQELLWDVPRLSTPQWTERWTHIVACAHNLLVLARGGLSTVGDPLLGADVDAGATGDAHPFAPVGHACSSTTTAGKSAGTGQRLSSPASDPPSGHSENEQKERFCLR